MNDLYAYGVFDFNFERVLILSECKLFAEVYKCPNTNIMLFMRFNSKRLNKIYNYDILRFFVYPKMYLQFSNKKSVVFVDLHQSP